MNSRRSMAALAMLISMSLSGCLSGDDGATMASVDDAASSVPVGGSLAIKTAPGTTPADYRMVDVGVEAFEPTIGVDSQGNVYTIAGTSVMKSIDGGATWTNVSPQVAERNVPPTTLDPLLYVDPVTDRVYYNHLYLGCTYLAYSDDGGTTWITNPAACGVPGVDHQSVSAGPSQLPAPAYGGRAVYLCTNQLYDATCAASLDGGITFPVWRPVFRANDAQSCGGIHGHVGIADDSTVYLPAWRCDQPWIGISRDSGFTWEGFRIDPVRTAGPADPAIAVDTENNPYYFWVDIEGQPYLTTSIDQGRTWSPAVSTAFEGLQIANIPSIVAGSPGRAAFTYIGTTEGEPKFPGDVSEDTPWNLYVTYSLNALDDEPTFTTVQLNPANEPIHQGPCGGGYRCGNLVDFIDIARGPDGRVYSTGVDLDGNARVGVQLNGPSLLAAAGMLSPPAALA